MINECFNPDCKRGLHYLREGRIVRILRVSGEDISIEHFWLCGSCSESHEFLFLAKGEIAVGKRANRDALREYYFDDDTVLPWPKTARD